jgi:phosphoribosyl 1,2-cyclic phosphodiesterase
MSLIVTSLASGSSGNAFLVQMGANAILVEAGLGARKIERHLVQRGVDPAALSAIVVSHEHHDHMQSAGALARRHGLPIVCSPGTAAAMGAEWRGLAILPLNTDGITVGGVELWGFDVPHDAAQPQGILLEHDGDRVGWALDLGTAPPHVPECLAQADLVIVEANHDRERLFNETPYSWPMKNRIAGPRGHLSNLQAAALLAKVGEDGRKRTVWLAHLSERANDHPRKVLRDVNNYLDMAGVDCLTLQVAERNHPSATWQAPLHQQWLFETA